MPLSRKVGNIGHRLDTLSEKERMRRLHLSTPRMINCYLECGENPVPEELQMVGVLNLPEGGLPLEIAKKRLTGQARKLHTMLWEM